MMVYFDYGEERRKRGRRISLSKLVFLFGLGPVEGDLARLQRGPFHTLPMVRQDHQRGKDEDRLDGQALAIVMITFSGPLEKLGHVLRQLRLGGFRAIGVFDLIVVQLLGHRNVAATEVRIVMQTSFAFDASRFLLVAGQQIEHVVATILPT